MPTMAQRRADPGDRRTGERLRATALDHDPRFPEPVEDLTVEHLTNRRFRWLRPLDLKKLAC